MGPGTNWNPGALPDGTATFTSSAFNAIITFSANQTTIQNIKFTGGLYSFGLGGTSNSTYQFLNITGGGFSNAMGQIFNVFAYGDLFFQNSSTADKITIDVASAQGNASSSGVTFSGSSTLGSATINNLGKVTFVNSSNAGAPGGGATINNGSVVAFEDNSTAGGVTIVNNAGGAVLFENFHWVAPRILSTMPVPRCLFQALAKMIVPSSGHISQLARSPGPAQYLRAPALIQS